MSAIIEQPADTNHLALHLAYVALDPLRLGSVDWEDVPNLTEHEWNRVSAALERVRQDLRDRGGARGRRLWLESIE